MRDATAEKIMNPNWDNNPVKSRVRDIAFGVFKQSNPMEDVEEYEVIDAGKWELHVRVKPKADSSTRLFKIKISEQL